MVPFVLISSSARMSVFSVVLSIVDGVAEVVSVLESGVVLGALVATSVVTANT